MEKKMENEMETTLGPFKGYVGILSPKMENQREKNMDNEMETGVIKGLQRVPSVQIIPT